MPLALERGNPPVVYVTARANLYPYYGYKDREKKLHFFSKKLLTNSYI
jgi:hypothetical protein